MARLPTPGGDDGDWGDVLNNYLSVELNPDGSLKKAADITNAQQAAADAQADATTAINDLADKVDTTDPRLSDARLTIKKTGDVIGTRKNLNLIEGTGITLAATDNSSTDTVDLTVTSSGSGESASSAIGNTIMAMGDSITANGWAASPTGTNARVNDGRAYLGWAILMSKGRLIATAPPGSSVTAATGGFTTQQIIDTWLPVVVTQKPKICVVCAGTNDNPDTDAKLAALQARLRLIWTTLSEAGILPVVCTVPPRNDMPAYGSTRLNSWIKLYAAAHGFPCADFFGALVDPATVGTYAAGMASDGIHPTAAGGKLMGQVLWEAIEPHVGSAVAPLAVNGPQGASDTVRLNSNALFLDDSNSDGMPNGWSANEGDGTAQIDPGAPVGNWFKITRGSSNYSVISGSISGLNAGDRLLLCCRIKTDFQGGRGSIALRHNAGTVYNGIQINVDLTGEGAWAAQWNHTAGSNPRLLFSVDTVVGASMSIAQLTLLNLTTGAIQTL